jgi:hypothetical protein
VLARRAVMACHLPVRVPSPVSRHGPDEPQHSIDFWLCGWPPPACCLSLVLCLASGTRIEL